MDPKFYLKHNKNSKKKTPIYMSCRFKGNNLKIAVGLKVLPSNWSFDKQRLKRGVYKAFEINSYIDRCYSEMKEIFYELKNGEGLPQIYLLRKEFNHRVMGVPRNDDLLSFFKKHVESQEDILARATYCDYMLTFRVLKEFDQQWKRKVDYNTIDLEFYDDFRTFILSTKKQSLNTFGKRIKVIRTILNAATERKMNFNFAYKSRHFKYVQIESDHIFLTPEELKMIIDANLKTKNQKKARDIFIVCCLCGIRFSDYTQIMPSNILTIKGQKMLYIRMKKTKTRITIPLHSKAIEILEKCDYILPKMSNGYFNSFLKQIGKIAAIKDDVIFTRNICGKEKEVRYKKYEFLLPVWIIQL